jgi:hypothetical protein
VPGIKYLYAWGSKTLERSFEDYNLNEVVITRSMNWSIADGIICDSGFIIALGERSLRDAALKSDSFIDRMTHWKNLSAL